MNSSASDSDVYVPPIWSWWAFIDFCCLLLLVPTYIANPMRKVNGVNFTPHYLTMATFLTCLLNQSLLEFARFININEIDQFSMIGFTTVNFAIVTYNLRIGSISSQLYIKGLGKTSPKSLWQILRRFLARMSSHSLFQFFVFIASTAVTLLPVYVGMSGAHGNVEEMVVIAKKNLILFVVFNGFFLTTSTMVFCFQFRKARLFVLESWIIMLLFWGLVLAAMIIVTKSEYLSMRPETAVYNLVSLFNFMLMTTLLTPIITAKKQMRDNELQSSAAFPAILFSRYLYSDKRRSAADDDDDEEEEEIPMDKSYKPLIGQPFVLANEEEDAEAITSIPHPGHGKKVHTDHIETLPSFPGENVDALVRLFANDVNEAKNLANSEAVDASETRKSIVNQNLLSCGLIETMKNYQKIKYDNFPYEFHFIITIESDIVLVLMCPPEDKYLKEYTTFMFALVNNAIFKKWLPKTVISIFNRIYNCEVPDKTYKDALLLIKQYIELVLAVHLKNSKRS